MRRVQSAAAASAEEVHGQVAALLAAQDQRYTAQRRAIVVALTGLGRPATIGELVEATPGLPVSTAYRNVTVLSEANVLRRVNGSDELSRFELSEELSGHHHHAVCENCGLVVDAAASARLEGVLGETARAIAEAIGFDVTDHRLELVGRCSSCRATPA
jgi:Fur family ferric uptake transcriptional regulator